MQVITVCVIDRLFEVPKTVDKLRKSNILKFNLIIVEEVITICVLNKIIDRISTMKGLDSIVDMILTKEVLEKFKEMYETKKHTMIYIEVLLNKICQIPNYQKMLVEDIKYEVF